MRIIRPAQVLGLLLMVSGFVEIAFAQNPQPLSIFKNYFVTGDYMVAGWNEGAPDGTGFAPGTINVPDTTQISALGGHVPPGVQMTVPKGADIVAAFLYWATVESNQSAFAGQQAFFNKSKIVGAVLGNPNAPTSWSSGGCTGSSLGAKTMRVYRADVRPFLPLDLDPNSSTFGAIDVTNAGKPIPVRLADSGSNGHTAPFTLGASLVVIYRVLSPANTPLNAIVLYDGSFAPNNSGATMSQNLVGFYQPGVPPSAVLPFAKLTHIVANGQTNKSEQAYLNNTAQPLPSLYSGLPPFPGVYNQNGSAWDNPTWVLNQYASPYVSINDISETTSVLPSASNSGCVNWGAMILSTTVQDTDHDGLLDVWEQNGGYTDAVSGNPIALPGANYQKPDLYVELAYLTLRDGAGNVLHSHLPKQQALDAVGQAFSNQGISVHFDLPAGVYSNDPNPGLIISTGAAKGEISESALLCAACAYPHQPAISWKGGFESVQNDPQLGNFQAGRSQAYRYALFAHSMGEPRSYWGSAGNALANADSTGFAYSLPQLVSIVNTGTTATVKIRTPTLLANGVSPQVTPLVVKPGDCSSLNPPPLACTTDQNTNQVTISGSLIPGQFTAGTTPPPLPLNGNYAFRNVQNLNGGNPDANGMITTTFQITTSGLPDGTYQFSCPAAPTNPACVPDPQLGVSYLGPTTSSGHGDFPGGGDLAVTLGLWGADDVAGCQPDPSQPPTAQGYCNNQVGTLNVQIGTFMHELGHTLTLAHGGTYYQPNSSVPSYDFNCKPNFLSVMNYLFQVRGFVDGGFDFSGQTLPPLNETSSAVGNIARLSETTGVGLEGGTTTAAHFTRWYSQPNAADLKLGHFATAHCDGSPLIQGEPSAVRVDGSLSLQGANNFSGPLDWNNDLIAGDDPITGQDLNHNGQFNDPPFNGFDDWQVLTDPTGMALQQINARSSGFGFSEGGGLKAGGGGGLKAGGGGGVDNEGGGLKAGGGGGLKAGGGGGLKAGGGGGIEQDSDTANATVDAPSGLACTQPLAINGMSATGCTASTGGTFLEKGKSVPLTWVSPDFGQIRSYDVWRAVGSFPKLQSVLANIGKFSKITVTPLTGAPPSPQYIDSAVKANITYTYFVVDSNLQHAISGASGPIVVHVKF